MDRCLSGFARSRGVCRSASAFDAFDAAFGKPEEEEAPAVVQEEDIEDEDAFDISGIDLPEGVTFRS